MTEYERALLAINSSNLAANVENVTINEQLLDSNKRHEGDSARIIALLGEILEVIKNDSK